MVRLRRAETGKPGDERKIAPLPKKMLRDFSEGTNQSGLSKPGGLP